MRLLLYVLAAHVWLVWAFPGECTAMLCQASTRSAVLQIWPQPVRMAATAWTGPVEEDVKTLTAL